MDDSEQQADPEEVIFVVEEDAEEKGWTDVDGFRVVVLSTPIKSGQGTINELRLSEPNGFNYEKLGQPFKMMSSSKKKLDDDDEEDVVIEINIKKLNRYIELCNTPQLGFGEARLMGMSDAKKAHGAMLDFFGQ